MPYIKQENRVKFFPVFDALLESEGINNAGELNYLITCICNQYLYKKGESYQTYADIVSSLENAKLEYYRKKIGPYEDKKELENGAINEECNA